MIVVTPDGGTPEEVVVAVGRADSENQVAHKALVALQQAAGSNYSIEMDDGEEIVVRQRDGVELFEIAVARNTVDGVSVEFDPEW